MLDMGRMGTAMGQGQPLMSASVGFCLTMVIARASCAGDGIEPFLWGAWMSAIGLTVRNGWFVEVEQRKRSRVSSKEGWRVTT